MQWTRCLREPTLLGLLTAWLRCQASFSNQLARRSPLIVWLQERPPSSRTGRVSNIDGGSGSAASLVLCATLPSKVCRVVYHPDASSGLLSCWRFPAVLARLRVKRQPCRPPLAQPRVDLPPRRHSCFAPLLPGCHHHGTTPPWPRPPMAGRPPPLPPAPLPPGPLEFPLTAFPDHPVARALRDDGLSRRWLLPVGGLPVTSAGGDGGGGKGPVPSRPVATAMVSRAALTQPGLAQRVGWTSDVEADDGRVVQQVHLMVRCEGAVGAAAATDWCRGMLRVGGGMRECPSFVTAAP